MAYLLTDSRQRQTNLILTGGLIMKKLLLLLALTLLLTGCIHEPIEVTGTDLTSEQACAVRLD